MEIKIEQVAIATNTTEQADKIIDGYKDLGFDEWVFDVVTAEGTVFGKPVTNVARLAFNYQMGHELEILTYLAGDSWHDRRCQSMTYPFQSHMGLHVTEQEMISWKRKMKNRKIDIAQEVYTLSHTNPHIAGKRKYHYVVFDSRHKLGFDLKLIERIMLEESE